MDKARLITLIRDIVSNGMMAEIKGDDDKFMIDSFVMMLLLTAIEENFSVGVDIEQFDFDQTVSVLSLADTFVRYAHAL